MTRKQQGIALIQILLITVILSVFAMYLTLTARQQVEIASWSQDRAEAEVEIHSTEAEILFQLLTEGTQKLSIESSNSTIGNHWNFYGQSFKHSSYVNISIQDQSSLLNLHFLHKGRLNKLLVKNGIDAERSSQIMDRLLDWQDADNMPRANGEERGNKGAQIRNGLIADITELDHVFNLTSFEKELFKNNAGIFYVGDFNPLTASEQLLSAISNPDVAQQILTLRANRELTRAQFERITDLVGVDDFRFYPANILAITYTAKINQAVIVREMVISLSPYAKKKRPPYNVLLDRS